MEPRPESLWVKVPARGTPDRYAVEGSCQPPPHSAHSSRQPPPQPSELGLGVTAREAVLTVPAAFGAPSPLWRPVLTPCKHAPPVLSKPVHALCRLPGLEAPGRGTCLSSPARGHSITFS